jgi:hypothetical protein
MSGQAGPWAALWAQSAASPLVEATMGASAGPPPLWLLGLFAQEAGGTALPELRLWAKWVHAKLEKVLR